MENLLTKFTRTKSSSNDGCAHLYSGIDKTSLATKVDQLFTDSGYTLIEGSAGNGVYEKGNRIMRILFGAFVKYFKFGIKISDDADGLLEVAMVKKTSGMSGGLIGMSQVKKEVARMSDALKSI